MDFTSQVQNISEEQLESLFSGVSPLTTTMQPNVDEGVNKDTNPNVPQIQNNDLGGIPEVDLDELEKQAAETDEKAKPEEKKVEAKVEEGQEEEKKEEEKQSEADIQQINQILKSTVNFLVEKGIFKDFEGREKMEMNDETYAELAVKQHQEQLQEMFDELVDSTGDYGKAIIHHIKQGGNPDEVIDVFKEQKQLETFDLQDKKGQLSIIEKYYSEVIGWPKQKIDRYVSSLEGTDGAIEDEAKDVHTKYDEIYTKQLSQIKEQQAEQHEKQKREQKEYIDKLTTSIDKYETLTDQDKKLIKNSVLRYDKKLPNGTPINDFYLKFYEIQRDPQKYIDLIHFVVDNEGYKKKLQVKQDGEAVKNSWKFVKDNGAIKKTSTEIDNPAAKKMSNLDFSGVLKRNN